MSYSVSPGNIFGRIGKGIGQGLSEQLPKEIERSRLASGLKELGKKKELTPFEQFAELSSIPGVTPQMIDSGSKLLRESARGRALQAGAGGEGKQSPFPIRKNQEGLTRSNESPSITEEEPLSRFQEGYIPPTQEQIYESAGKMFNENPALFGNDPQKAIEAAENQALKEEKIASAFQTQHKNLSEIQDNIVKRLGSHSDRLGVAIPSNVYSLVEDEAIQATKSKKKGGGGLTEQEAMKKYGKKLDEISRDYSAIDAIGNWGITARKAKDSLNSMRSLQQKFEERNDLENFADSLISKNKLSPIVANAIAYPVSREPALAKELKSLPDLPKAGASKGYLEPGAPISERIEKTAEIAPMLSKLMTDSSSPLAIAYELEKKGYDPSTWIDYLVSHRKDLNLKENQGRQIDKPGSFTGTLNDWWLSEWSGL